MNTQASEHERRTLAAVRNYLADWAELGEHESGALRTLGYLDALIGEDIDVKQREKSPGPALMPLLTNEPAEQDSIVIDSNGMLWHHLGDVWVAWSAYDKDHVHQQWSRLQAPMRLVFAGPVE